MSRILFVDDDPYVLEGLQNMLRRQRRQWDMVFVSSGQLALEEMQKDPFQILISDMRMPHMDGPTLLTIARDQYPNTTRLILSGQADRESMIRALPVSQQFLSKPCQPTELKNTVSRILNLRSRFPIDGASTLLKEATKLDNLPETYWSLRQAAERPEVTVEELASIIEADSQIKQALMEVASSPSLALESGSEGVQALLSAQGPGIVSALVLMCHAFKEHDGMSKDTVEQLRDLRQHSLNVAFHVRRLLDGSPQAIEGFTAALLHELGSVILLNAATDRKERATQKVHDNALPEDRDLGAYVLGRWGLPVSIVEAVEFHHDPATMTHQPAEALACLHVVDSMLCRHAEPPAPDRNDIDWGFIERSGLTETANTWLKQSDFLRRVEDSQQAEDR